MSAELFTRVAPFSVPCYVAACSMIADSAQSGSRENLLKLCYSLLRQIEASEGVLLGVFMLGHKLNENRGILSERTRTMFRFSMESSADRLLRPTSPT